MFYVCICNHCYLALFLEFCFFKRMGFVKCIGVYFFKIAEVLVFVYLIKQ